MKKTKKATIVGRHAGAAGLIALLLLLAGCGGGTEPTDEPEPTESETTAEADGEPVEVNIGALVPLTGAAAGFGEQVTQGLELWAKQATERHADQGIEFKVHFEDNGEGANAAVSGYSRLVSQYDVPAVFSSLTTPTLAVMPQANEDEVVMLNGGLGSALREAGPYLFATQLNISAAGELLVGYASEELADVKSVALLYRNDDYGTGGRDSFTAAFEKVGVSVGASEGFAAGTTDFSGPATVIAQEAPDAVVVIGFGQEVANALLALERAGYKGLFLSDSGGGQPEVIELSGAVAEGRMYYTAEQWNAEDPANDTATQFLEAFREEHGSDPGTNSVVYYEAGQIVEAAVAQLVADGEEITGAAIREAILELGEIETVTGSIRYTEDDQLGSRAVTITTVEDGAFKQVEALSAEDMDRYRSLVQ